MSSILDRLYKKGRIGERNNMEENPGARRGNGGMMGSHKNASLDQTSYNVASSSPASRPSLLLFSAYKRSAAKTAEI